MSRVPVLRGHADSRDGRPLRMGGAGFRAWDEHLTIDIQSTDAKDTWRLELRNGARTHTSAPQTGTADATLTAARAELLAMA